jgi:hypothetical protein
MKQRPPMSELEWRELVNAVLAALADGQMTECPVVYLPFPFWIGSNSYNDGLELIASILHERGDLMIKHSPAYEDAVIVRKQAPN